MGIDKVLYFKYYWKFYKYTRQLTLIRLWLPVL